jgi:hypothetical protein
LIDHGIIDRNVYLRLRHELDGIFGPAINLGMAALPSEASNLGHGDPLYAHVTHGLADIFELERSDNCSDQLHVMPSLEQFIADRVRPARLVGAGAARIRRGLSGSGS